MLQRRLRWNTPLDRDSTRSLDQLRLVFFLESPIARRPKRRQSKALSARCGVSVSVTPSLSRRQSNSLSLQAGIKLDMSGLRKILVQEAGTNTAVASQYSLELISPVAVGTGSPAMHSGDRIYKAYPGIAYNIRAVVIGGSYPYTFALNSTATSAGMTVNANTGEINWPSPSTGQTGLTPTLTVTDSAGAQVTGSWAITVSTSGFKFIDGVSGTNYPTGTGTIGNPIRTLGDVKNGGATFSDILYFRTGTYNLNEGALNSSGYLNLGFDDSGGTGRPMVWLAYPGETPTIDIQYPTVVQGHVAPFIKLTGPNIYLDSLTCTNDFTKTFELDCTLRRAPIVRRCTFTNGGAGADGSNSAFLMMTANTAGPSYGMAIQNNSFGTAGHNAVKSYSMNKSLIEDNMFGVNGGVAQKAGVTQYTVRKNTFTSSDWGVTGNMNTYAGGDNTYGEICYNLFLNTVASGIEIGRSKISTIGRTDCYRNTVLGGVTMENVATADGPYVFTRNVIINSGSSNTPFPFFTVPGTPDTSRITRTENLTGTSSDAITNSSGLLNGTYRTQYLYVRGFEIP